MGILAGRRRTKRRRCSRASRRPRPESAAQSNGETRRGGEFGARTRISTTRWAYCGADTSRPAGASTRRKQLNITRRLCVGSEVAGDWRGACGDVLIGAASARGGKPEAPGIAKRDPNDVQNAGGCWTYLFARLGEATATGNRKPARAGSSLRS